MQKFLLAIAAAALPVLPALAEQPAFPKPEDVVKPGKALPLKGANSVNSCAAFGAGFVKIAGTDTCVKVGGAYLREGGRRRQYRRRHQLERALTRSLISSSAVR